jgi:NADH:ubiquinone oxidoreductase subunit D
VKLRPEADLVRGVALEMERIAMHLVALTGLATDIAFLQGGASYGRLRTAIINATQRVCGNRFGRGWPPPGAVHRTARRRKTLQGFARDIHEVNGLMRPAASGPVVGTGVLSPQAALDAGLTGVAPAAWR